MSSVARRGCSVTGASRLGERRLVSRPAGEEVVMKDLRSESGRADGFCGRAASRLLGRGLVSPPLGRRRLSGRRSLLVLEHKGESGL